jgi:hypothetical protein
VLNESRCVTDRSKNQLHLASLHLSAKLKVQVQHSLILYSSVGIGTWIWAVQSGFDSRQRQSDSFLLHASRPALGPIQHPVQLLEAAGA